MKLFGRAKATIEAAKVAEAKEKAGKQWDALKQDEADAKASLAKLVADLRPVPARSDGTECPLCGCPYKAIRKAKVFAHYFGTLMEREAYVEYYSTADPRIVSCYPRDLLADVIESRCERCGHVFGNHRPKNFGEGSGNHPTQ